MEKLRWQVPSVFTTLDIFHPQITMQQIFIVIRVNSYRCKRKRRTKFSLTRRISTLRTIIRCTLISLFHSLWRVKGNQLSFLKQRGMYFEGQEKVKLISVIKIFREKCGSCEKFRFELRLLKIGRRRKRRTTYNNNKGEIKEMKTKNLDLFVQFCILKRCGCWLYKAIK